MIKMQNKSNQNDIKFYIKCFSLSYNIHRKKSYSLHAELQETPDLFFVPEIVSIKFEFEQSPTAKKDGGGSNCASSTPFTVCQSGWVC